MSALFNHAELPDDFPAACTTGVGLSDDRVNNEQQDHRDCLNFDGKGLAAL